MRVSTTPITAWVPVANSDGLEVCVRDLSRPELAAHVNALEKARLAYNRRIVAEARASITPDEWAATLDRFNEVERSRLLREHAARVTAGQDDGLRESDIHAEPDLVAIRAAIHVNGVRSYEPATDAAWTEAALAFCAAALVDHRGYEDQDGQPVPFDAGDLRRLYVDLPTGNAMSILWGVVTAIHDANSLSADEKKTSRSRSGSGSGTPATPAGSTTIASPANTAPAVEEGAPALG